MLTNHPTQQFLPGDISVLEEIIRYCRNYATTYANDRAEEIEPIIMSGPIWVQHWDFAWKSAWEFATEDIAPNLLLPQGGE